MIRTICPLLNLIQYGRTSLIWTPMGQKKVSLLVISEVEMHARVVLGVGKGVLFREVSSVQEFNYT